MFCKKCGNEIKEGETKCSKCGANIKNKTLPIMIAICVVVVIVVAVVFAFKDKLLVGTNADNNMTTAMNEKNNSSNKKSGNDGKFESSSANVFSNGTSSTSFANLKADDNSFDKTQKSIIDYFDSNYFSALRIDNLQKYPQVYKESKITTNAEVIKVLKSTDDEFEVLAVQGGGLGASVYDGSSSIVQTGYGNMSITEIPENKLMIIKGSQLSKRLMKGDVIKVYARYNNVDNFDIDGKSFILPVLTNINMIQYSENDEKNYRFNIDTIRAVAEYVFGKDIKISTPAIGEDYNSEISYTFEPFYKITLDNQSNANFSSFNMYRTNGAIVYNDEGKHTVKRLFIAADFQHYIVTTYDDSLKYLYIDYFDKDLKKLWSREYQYNSNLNYASPIDYTSSQLAIVIDNDLHLLDLKTGEDIFNPVLVGSKIKLNMMTDGIILIGNDSKDTIMKIGYDGNTIFRTNGNINLSHIDYARTQIVNGKMVIDLEGSDPNTDFDSFQYLVLNSDGSIELSTEN